MLYHTLDSNTLGATFSNSLPQLLVLLNLVYIVCNYSKGIILHQRIVRPDRIIMRAIRSTFSMLCIYQLNQPCGFRNALGSFFTLFYISF